MTRIDSVHNPKVKYATRLQEDNRFRKREGVFVVEGQQEVRRALQFGFEPTTLFIQPDIATDFDSSICNCPTYEISAAVYEKMAYRGTVEGVLVVFKTPHSELSTHQLPVDGKIIILEGIEKPGNLGAILRNCEAFGISAVVLANSKIDIYHPNVIRSSVGCLFGMSVYNAESDEIIRYLEKNQCRLYITHLHSDALKIGEISFAERAAVAFGTEHSGLTDFWLDKGQNVFIPMRGTIDSLNLSNAVAICCYAMTQ